MRRKMAGHPFFRVPGRATFALLNGSQVEINSEGVEPLQQFHLALPAWRFVRPGGAVYFFQSLAFRFNISSSIDIGGVEAVHVQASYESPSRQPPTLTRLIAVA